MSMESKELPSLIDDAQFLAELDQVEGAAPRASADRASRVALATGFTAARRPIATPSTRPRPAEPVIPRDVNRWNLHMPPGVEDDQPAAEPGGASMIPAFLVILIGLSAGAASSIVVFHERVARIIALFAR
jgi:hypothetical protein